MILVTLGLHERPFYRLVKEIENLIQKKKIREEVIAQVGYTNYKIKGAKCFDFIEFRKMKNLIKKSSIVLTHGGAASIMIALEYEKPTIVVPRRKYLNEHTDDHQMQITKELEDRRMIIAVYDIKNLESAIKKAKKFKPISNKHKKNNKIFEIVEQYIENLAWLSEK